MITRERIEQLDPIKTTLLATIPNQLLTLFLLLSYLIRGITDFSTGYADGYYGYYITGNVEGSLTMDMAGVLFSFIALVAITTTIRKPQAKFMLIAIASLLVSIPFTQMNANNIITIVLCIFGYINLKKYPLGLSETQHVQYIPMAMLICYSVGIIFGIVQQIRYFGDLLVNTANPDLETFPEGFEGEDVPEWVTWGANSGNTDISFINQIAPLLIYLVITIVAIILIYLGLRGRGSKFYRLGAGVYLLSYVLPCLLLFVGMFNLFDVISILVLPEVILSIWLIIYTRRGTVQDNSTQGHISSEIE